MSDTKPLWIVKLGGSLSYNPLLLKWLNQLYQHGRGKVVIVCGGGKFADQVRDAANHWQLNDNSAHHMALLAMEQFAHLLKGIAPHYQLAATEDAIQYSVQQGEIPIWLPYKMVIKDKTIPCSWDMTSDSLALWLAKKLGITCVILVKSVPLIHTQYDFNLLISEGIIDKYSLYYASDLSVSILNVDQFEQVNTIFEQEKILHYLQ